MSSRGQMFAGCTVALVTPFRGGEVDYEVLRRLVDWHVEQGTQTISPVGTTGESPTLSHDEHERVIATVVEQAAGRVQVMAGTGSNATSEAIRLTKFAAKIGANGALLVAPYYNRPTQEGLYAHFAAVAESTDLPQVIYNIPSRTGRNVEPETVERIARISPIVAIKEASGSLDQVSDIISRTNLTVLSGDDSLTLPMMAVGGAGVVSVVGNLVPRDVMALIREFESGNLAEARRLHSRLYPLCRDLLGLSSNPVPVKEAMEQFGRCSAEVRLPLCRLSDTARSQLRGSLDHYMSGSHAVA